MKKVILASGSPRRRELLAQIGIEFDVRVSEQEEIYHSTVPEEIVKELALLKAEHVAENMQEEERAGKVIIGADTVVVQDGRILGKPQGEEDAFRMLKKLQGRSHEVYTGTALLYFEGKGEKDGKQSRKDKRVCTCYDRERNTRLYRLWGTDGQSGRLWNPGEICGIYRTDRGRLL